jgi:hypothetical protein
MKQVFALYGKADCGKSYTIWRVYQLLEEQFPDFEFIGEAILEGDIRVIIKIKGVIIGIESQGDPNSRLFRTIPFFVHSNCNIIVCATRTRGATVNLIYDLEPDYSIKWFEQKYLNAAPTTIQESNNDKMAKSIVESITIKLQENGTL